MKLLSCICYLARQGLPLRGHHAWRPRILRRQFISAAFVGSTRMSSDENLASQKGVYLPRDHQWAHNDDGSSCAATDLAEINSALWFSLIADEASDISHNQYINISIRWVDSNYEIHEDTLCLVQLPDTKAATLFSVIKDVMIRCSLPISKCMGQAFDGASNMSGIRNGVQALIKGEEARAVYVHCLAHSLNLCVQEVTKSVSLYGMWWISFMSLCSSLSSQPNGYMFLMV